MRQPHIYALAAALALTTVLVLVVGGDPAPEPEPFFTAQVLGGHTESTTTTMDIDFSDEDAELLELSEVEIELTEDAAARSITTTTTAPATPTTHTHASENSGTPKPKTTATTGTTQPPSPPTTVTPEFRSDYEAEFHGQINSLRASNGLPALARNGSLNARARDWAKTMAQSGGLKHSNIGSLVPPWTAAAENVGKGGSVSTIWSLLKGSGSHVSNMVGTYTDVGIGVWRDAGGTLWTVHVFTR
jgi:uncharacterized protein YkwD